MHHLYGSKLTTLLNRLGHSESHSFPVELETLIAKALEQTSSLPNPLIREPDVPSRFYSEFDNFDQLINTMIAAGSVHIAHGIMKQEVLTANLEDHGGTAPEVPSSMSRR